MKIMIILLVCFLSSVAGSICGIGGGVMIKPILDATGIMDVASVSFLSGCTVLSMSAISLCKNLKQKQNDAFDTLFASILAAGSVLGGMLGKSAFQYILEACENKGRVTAIQSAVLLLITAGTLAFELCRKKISTRNIKNRAAVFLIGCFLGLLSAFLGIGGGPVNLIALLYLFSMKTKEAALYSIYIILYSQIASLCYSIFAGTIPAVRMELLFLMTGCGISGGITGSAFSRNMDHKRVDRLFIALMGIIILMNLYNICRYL